MQTFIRARVTVPGIHCWPDAPAEFAPLRASHRHLFTFEIEQFTGHGNRAVEFLHAAKQVEGFLRTAFDVSGHWGCLNFGENSCEMLATKVLDAFGGVQRCTVWEDMENAGGAVRS